MFILVIELEVWYNEPCRALCVNKERYKARWYNFRDNEQTVCEADNEQVVRVCGL